MLDWPYISDQSTLVEDSFLELAQCLRLRLDSYYGRDHLKAVLVHTSSQYMSDRKYTFSAHNANSNQFALDPPPRLEYGCLSNLSPISSDVLPLSEVKLFLSPGSYYSPSLT